MKKVEDLKEGDYIAFGFNYNGGKHDSIEVSDITMKHGDSFIVHFLYGHHSLSEIIKPEDVLAIGNPNGKSGIKGWSGNFDIIQPENDLIKQNLK